jgi:4-hydroxybenzoate polyprenyltransferase
VLAGTESLGVDMSSWILITTLCISLFLGSIKRFQELRQFGTKSRSVLMKYSPELLIRFSEISSIMALVFYSFYALSERPKIVISIPFVLFGIFRYWYIVEGSHKGESPTEVLLNDLPLLISILLWAIICLYLLNH